MLDLCIFSPSFKLPLCWLRSFIPAIKLFMLPEINERLLPLTGGQPLAGQFVPDEFVAPLSPQRILKFIEYK
ncbi:hypothetical protein Xcab_00220 [Xenorhabdus cabanillasii JM26]|nr:hypothetical protein Xcab_00220 [Xenorhabdus cabanillasii JM26]